MIVSLKRVGYPKQIFKNVNKLELEFDRNIGRIIYSDSLTGFEFELTSLTSWTDLSWSTNLSDLSEPTPASNQSIEQPKK